MLIEDNTYRYSFFQTFNNIVVSLNRSSVCLIWRGLKTIRFVFLKLMGSLFARHHCVNLSISEFKISGRKLKSLWGKLCLRHEQKE